jgi:hypothetical protein
MPGGGRWGVSNRKQLDVGCSHHDRFRSYPDDGSAAFCTKCEIERLRAIKAPLGDESSAQQARSWERVHEEAAKLGLWSFVPTPILSNGCERLVQFIRSLARERDEARQAAARSKADGGGDV